MSHDAPAAPAIRTGSIDVKGRQLALAQVLGVEAKPAESWTRNGFFLITGLLCPIVSIIVFTILTGPTMWIVGLATASAPFLGLLVAGMWAKPWGVVVEEQARYRTIYVTGDKAEAERIAGEIRTALG